MNDKTLASALAETVDLVTRADVGALDVLERMRSSRAGQLRSPSFEAGSATSRVSDDDERNAKEYLAPELRGRDTHSDPTGQAAVQALNYGDRAEQDRDDAEAIVKRMRRDASSLVSIFARYNQRASTAADRALVAKENRQSERGCQSCARVPTRGDAGKPKDQRTAWWNEVFKTEMIDDKPVDICRWCWEGEVGVKRTGALPAIVDIESYRDTGRARRRAS